MGTHKIFDSANAASLFIKAAPLFSAQSENIKQWKKSLHLELH